MPFVWKGGDEPPLEKRRRQLGRQRLDELHFKWLGAIASGDRQTGIETAIEWNKLAEEVFSNDLDIFSDEQEAANDD